MFPLEKSSDAGRSNADKLVDDFDECESVNSGGEPGALAKVVILVVLMFDIYADK